MELLQDDGSWVVTEFAEAALGDERRNRRLLEIATDLAAHPRASFPEACRTKARLKALYRFFDTDEIEGDAILEAHLNTTLERIADTPLVLAVQDTTEFDFTHHQATTGMGPLANEGRQGIFAHSTLAITPERVPLGLLSQLVWARDKEAEKKAQTRKRRSIEEKESSKWLLGLGAVIQAKPFCPDTRFVCIADSEADIYDLFLAPRPEGVDLLIRACQNRRVEDEPHNLLETLLSQEAAATLHVQVPRRQNQPARSANLTIRFCPLTLCPPKYRSSKDLLSVDVWAVAAMEEHPPKGVEPIAWILLTTCEVNTLDAALEKVAWYTCRWGIEIVHKILKSGCQVEARQLETADRIKRCLSIYSVIAWRILYATMLSRTLPDAPCSALLEPDEWQALYCAIHHTPHPPTSPPALGQAVVWIAQLGGFLNRRGDGQPGVTVLWKGFQHLNDLTKMYRIMRPSSLR